MMVADPDGSKSSFEEGLKDRKLASYPNPDFTGSLCVHNSDPSKVADAIANVDRMARVMRTEGEERTLDQLRADIALDLLAGPL